MSTPRRSVWNECPRCDKKELWDNLSTTLPPHPNEGYQLCGRCRTDDRIEQKEYDERENRLTQLAEDIAELKERGLLP